MRISGIRSVDFLITATGEGVVNHNGSASVYNPAAGRVVNNHLFPKLRGLDPMRKAAASDETDKVRGLSLADPSLTTASLIVSANCVRHHLFKNVSFGLSSVTRENVGDALASLQGLVRGYLITDGGANFARKSALYFTDFECANPGLRYNQGSKSGERSETSIFSHFSTDKNLHYVGSGSLSIEDLQFIPLENSLGRSSFSEVVSESEGALIAEHITQYLQDLSGNADAKATFLTNAVRKGAFAQEGEAGILLNDTAIDVLVKEVIELLSLLYIRQGKGYMQVTDVKVDYNDERALRIARDPASAVPTKTQPYAVYYAQVDQAPGAFAAKMEALKAQLAQAKKDKKSSKKAPAVVADANAEGAI